MKAARLRGPDVTLTSKQALHAPGLLHADDPNPVRLYTNTGNISGLTLFSGKAARLIAGRDLSDIALYVQNLPPMTSHSSPPVATSSPTMRIRRCASPRARQAIS